MQEIFMDFDEDDNPVITVKGVKGPACKALTADLESKLGRVVSTELTGEYKEREASTRATARVPSKRN